VRDSGVNPTSAISLTSRSSLRGDSNESCSCSRPALRRELVRRPVRSRRTKSLARGRGALQSAGDASATCQSTASVAGFSLKRLPIGPRQAHVDEASRICRESIGFRHDRPLPGSGTGQKDNTRGRVKAPAPRPQATAPRIREGQAGKIGVLVGSSEFLSVGDRPRTPVRW